MSPREILWTPTPERAAATRMAAFIRWLEAERGLSFADHTALWEWSVRDLDAFWQAIWDFFGLESSAPATAVLAERRMPGAVWFPGMRTNFAQHMLRRVRDAPDRAALVVHSESTGRTELSWADLNAQVASVAARLRAMGVGQGDRVVAVLPNTETAMIAFLATASLGAVWSLCAPDMGHVAILDRFRQIAPKVLIAQDGYVHAGRMVDRRAVLRTITDGLDTVEHLVWVPVAGDLPEEAVAWSDLTGDRASLDFAQVPFDHPLWIVYSSGTTGNPKPIVHGHGGVLVEGAKQSLHQDIGPGDRFCWLTSSGWIMWNAQLTALGQGATLVMYDGAPNHPDMLALWRIVQDERLSYFGAGAAFFAGCLKAGVRPADLGLSALRSLGSTGSPLSEDAYDWIYRDVKPDIWLAPISGGTDLAGAFVAGNPMLPVRKGEMQARSLGCAVRAFDEEGRDLIGTVGELVCT
ncbi:MAG: AMP-binding protein, partial [Proteobacteria bacterium]|nr:AMP-binding protein [Pseudomonadota bacterium]